MDTFAFIIVIMSTFLTGGTLYYLATWLFNYIDTIESGDLEEWEYDPKAFEHDQTDPVRSTGVDQQNRT